MKNQFQVKLIRTDVDVTFYSEPTEMSARYRAGSLARVYETEVQRDGNTFTVDARAFFAEPMRLSK